MPNAHVIDRPQTGFYTTRFVKGGPLVPARIHRPCHCTINGGDDNAEHDWRNTCDRFPPLLAEVNGKPCDPFGLWPRVADRPITEAEYRFMTADAEWCRQHAPAEPKANPGQRIDLAAQAPIF